jgi:hypothetical protein
VALLADAIGLGEPARQLGVHVRGLAQAQAMHVVARRHELDAHEARAVDPPREDEVRDEGSLARPVDAGEAHPDLQRDTRLRRVHGERAALPRGVHIAVEQLA